MVNIYTDGSCYNKRGDGGYAIVYVLNDKIIKTYKSKPFEFTTSTRMEMAAIIKSMSMVKKGNEYTLYTDSEYCVNCLNKWIKSWIKNNSIKQKKNFDLLKRMWSFYKDKHGKKISVKHIKGHSGNKYNELADKLANEARKNE